MNEPRRGSVRSLVASLRPVHWLKNVPVGAGLVFGGKAADGAARASTLVAFACFCGVASAGYLVNDVVDRERDRTHPTRSSRPIAAGEVSPALALATAAVLGGGALAAAFATLDRSAAFGLLAYALLSLSYTLAWKHVGWLAAPVVAAGFVLRVLVGAYAAGVPPSAWLLSLTAVLALTLAIAKREAEARREVGEAPRRLRLATDVGLVASAVGYLAYALWPSTVALHGTHLLAVTAAPVALALWRFRALLRRDAEGQGPVSLVARDPLTLALGTVWAAACWILLR